jgi:nicotinate-nucleotide adenylyltransferase
MRIGLFGGTFDPPHLGHLILASEAKSQLDLERLLFILTPCPPHKLGQVITPVSQRLELLQAAIADDPAFSLSRVDLDRPPPHYAADTVLLLKQVEPQAELIYLIGGDALHDLPTWYEPGRLLAACDGLGVMRRPGDAVDLDSLEEEIPGLKQKVRFIEAPLLEISSSEIRQRLADGRPVRYFLPPAVYRLIIERNYYQSS